jgi:hypothetical protein
MYHKQLVVGLNIETNSGVQRNLNARLKRFQGLETTTFIFFVA